HVARDCDQTKVPELIQFAFNCEVRILLAAISRLQKTETEVIQDEGPNESRARTEQTEGRRIGAANRSEWVWPIQQREPRQRGLERRQATPVRKVTLSSDPISPLLQPMAETRCGTGE